MLRPIVLTPAAGRRSPGSPRSPVPTTVPWGRPSPWACPSCPENGRVQWQPVFEPSVPVADPGRIVLSFGRSWIRLHLQVLKAQGAEDGFERCDPLFLEDRLDGLGRWHLDAPLAFPAPFQDPSLHLLHTCWAELCLHG